MRMKKKKNLWLICLVIVVVGIVIYAGTRITHDQNTGALQIKHHILSDFTYEISDDHVTLVQYAPSNSKKAIVNIPDTFMGKPVTEIGEYCFSPENEVYDEEPTQFFEEVYLGKNIDTIRASAFDSCQSLLHVYGENQLQILEPYAFYACNNLETVEFMTDTLPDHVFSADLKLQYDNLEQCRLRSIGICALSHCKNIKTIGNQQELEYIGEAAFEGSGLETFSCNPDIEIGESALMDTPFYHNEEMIVHYNTLIKYAYLGMGENIVLPDGIKKVETQALHGDLSKIRNVYFPETTKTIDALIFDFEECPQQEICFYIPRSVEEMGDTYDNESIFIYPYEMKIVTTKGAYAEQYASEHGIPCETVESWEIPE